MSFVLTQNTQDKINAQEKKPSLVLEIDGYDYLFTLSSLERYIRVGDVGLEIDGSWVIGGTQNDERCLPYISMDGTTQTISQQLQQDKGGATSVSSIQVSLLDYRELVTGLISPGFVLDDILGRKAWVWLGFQDTLFPEDHFIIFSGLIDEISASGNIILNVAHPEQKKRQEIFKQRTDSLSTELLYASATIQSITYGADTQVSGTVRVRYTAGGTAGSEVVTVTGNDISVQIESGVSTANQIRNAIRKSSNAMALLRSADIADGESGTAQVTVSYTDLASPTEIALSDVSDFLSEYGTEFLTYVRIDDEIIRYTTIDSLNNELTISERGCFGTIPTNHDVDTEVVSYYRLLGSANDLALKVLMSGPEEYWVSNIPVSNFVRSASGTDVADTIFIAGLDVKQKHGLMVGDFITVTGSAYGANNVTLQEVSGIEITINGSIITCSGAGFVLDIGSTGVIAFKSQYNVLPDGLNLGGDKVDVEQFNNINLMMAFYMPDYDFYLPDTVSGKEFIDKEILYPANMFSLPRKGRVSAGVITPPLAIDTLPVLNADSIIRPESIQIKRSLGRYFYNTLIYKYDFDAVESDRPLAGYIRVDEDSKNRIPVGTKSLVIQSRGLRNDTATTSILNINTQRALERYKFAAEMITLSCMYGVGFTIEVGDVVYFGDENMRLVDSKNGVRGFSPRLCEVIDKKLNIATGRVDLTIVDTGYSSSGRYGIFSPASILDSGSTATELVIMNSYATGAYELEKDKWINYIGEPILIRSEDWATTYTSVLRGFDPSDPTIMLIDDIGASPAAGLVVDIIPYPSSSDPVYALKYKSTHCYFDPTIDVASGTSGTVFSVGAGDVSKLFVGATILVHDDDFSDESDEVKITDITGTTVTVDNDLGFTPSSLHFIELVGFSSDEGSAYRWL